MIKHGKFVVFGECEVEIEADNEADAIDLAEFLPINYWHMSDVIAAVPAEE